jgi:hypothetical protein
VVGRNPSSFTGQEYTVTLKSPRQQTTTAANRLYRAALENPRSFSVKTVASGWPSTINQTSLKLAGILVRRLSLAPILRALGLRIRTIIEQTDRLKSAKILKRATLKVYPGLPHGMCTTNPDQINADLLAFFKGAASAAAALL